MDLSEEINELAKCFPKEEIYNFNSEIRCASDSIALNIAEGSIGQANPEQSRFISYALRALAEVVSCLHKAKRRKYLNEDNFSKLCSDCYNLMNMIIGFKKL
jgi:four helix bundle protein